MSSYPTDGEQLAHFRILRKLGEGGMGAVFEAEDMRLGRRVALKLLPPELVGSSDRRARFLREARAAAAVEHRSIATVYEIGEDGDRVFIAMELVRGQSLRERLGAGPLPLREALSITAEIARGLAKAHAVGVVHRDLKPDNVMLNSESEVKILDFGIAKCADPALSEGAAAMPTTQPGRMLGTPGYMSPEQLHGEQVDGRSDVFSLGAILFELCTGERAFGGDTLGQLLVATMQHTPPPLSERRLGTPVSVELLVQRCLEKKPEERIPSAAALVQALEDVLASLAGIEDARTVATPAAKHTGDAVIKRVTPPERDAVARSRRMRAVLGLAAAGAVAVGAGFWTWNEREQPSQEPSTKVLEAPDAVLACPILEESAPGLPPGWLGAAAASLLCSDLSLVLGADPDRTRIPAQLLGLPEQVVDDFPKDPYGAMDARTRSVEVARGHDGWFDGRVEIVEGAFRLHLQLHGRRGPSGNVVESSDAQLHEAVFAAVDQLVENGSIERRALKPAEQHVFGCSDLPCLRRTMFSGQILAAAADRGQACNELATVGGYARSRASAQCGAQLAPPSGISHDDPVFLALDAVNEVGARPAAENIRRANELEALRARQTAAPTTRLLRLSEATLRMGAGEPAMARTLADQVLQSEPRSCEARSIAVGASSGRASRPGIVASFGAWCPWWADAYAERNWNDEDLLAFVRLTVQLSSPSPTYAPWLAYELLRRNRREEARGLASQLMQGAEARRKTGNYIMALVEADEGRVAAALRRLQDWLLGADVHAKDSTTELALVSALLLAEVLGADAEFADEFCQRFLLHDPPRVERGTPYLIVAQAAMRAPESVAFESLARVRELLDQGVFFGKGMGDEAYLQGALAFAQHDDRGAVKHWRQLAAVPAFQFSLRPEAFDRADEPELASAIDRFVVARPWRVGLAHVREARRAAKRGDTARARELAQQVIDKWATADAEIVHVKEMRALLANLAPK